MRHGKSVHKLERPYSHRRALLRHLTTALIQHERIETTLPKAKAMRKYAERMITFAKNGTLHARRHAARFVTDQEALSKLFTVLSTRFKDRSGGYTRVIKLGFRRGDAAPMAVIEYLGYQPKVVPAPGEKKIEEKKEKVKAKAKEPKKTKSTAKPKAEKPKKKGLFGRLKKEKGEE